MAGTILCVLFCSRPSNWNLVSDVMQNRDVFWFRIISQWGGYLEDLNIQRSQWLPGKEREPRSSQNEEFEAVESYSQAISFI